MQHRCEPFPGGTRAAPQLPVRGGAHIWVSYSPDLRHWGELSLVLPARDGAWWDAGKVGLGPTPLETPEGWLLLFHGVLTSCNGFVYSMGAVLLDLDEPWKVIARGRDYLLSPQRTYEQVGDVQNVVFPCAALVDAPTGRRAGTDHWGGRVARTPSGSMPCSLERTAIFGCLGLPLPARVCRLRGGGYSRRCLMSRSPHAPARVPGDVPYGDVGQPRAQPDDRPRGTQGAAA